MCSLELGNDLILDGLHTVLVRNPQESCQLGRAVLNRLEQCAAQVRSKVRFVAEMRLTMDKSRQTGTPILGHCLRSGSEVLLRSRLYLLGSVVLGIGPQVP